MFSEYDPIMGLGSPLDRFDFFYYKEQRQPIRLPITMKQVDQVQPNRRKVSVYLQLYE